MDKNDHSLDTSGDRGSIPLILPMTTLVIPSHHHEMIFVYIGGSVFMPTAADLEEVRNWCAVHQDDWPHNFNDLCVAFSDWPLSIEIFPAQNPNNEYVFMMECPWNPTESDINNWKEVLSSKTYDPFKKYTVYLYSDYFESIKRINKNLLPFL